MSSAGVSDLPAVLNNPLHLGSSIVQPLPAQQQQQQLQQQQLFLGAQRLNEVLKENEELKDNVRQNNEMMSRVLNSLHQHQAKQSAANDANTAELQSKNQLLEERLAKLQSEFDELKQSTSDSVDHLADNSRVNQLMAENRQLINNCESLRHELEKEKLLRTEDQTKIKELMKEFHDAFAQYQEAKKSVEELEQMKMKMGYRLEEVTAKLNSAHKTLQLKEEQLEQQNRDLDHLSAQAVQASTFEEDFKAERKSKEELNDVKLRLESRVALLEAELQKLRSGTRPLPSDDGVGPYPSPVSHSVIIEDFTCPLCPQVLPDADSLQLHVNDNHPEAVA